MTDRSERPKTPKRRRRLGIAALVVGGSATGVAMVGGNALAKQVCTSPLDAPLNSFFSKLPSGVSGLSCDGTVTAKISPNQVISGLSPMLGEKLPPIQGISISFTLPTLPANTPLP